MEKKHRCKLCFRNFANGRALGGHMRSHMMKLYAEQKASKLGGGEEKEEEEEEKPFHDFRPVRSYSSTSSPSPSSSSEEEDDGDEGFEEESEEVKGLLDYELRENPKKTSLLVDHEVSVLLQDRESETESSKKKSSICRRSKRVRKSRISDFNYFSMKEIFQVKRSKSNVDHHEYSPMAEAEPLSSVSDITSEEHVAQCLMMLSRDKWEKEEIEYQDQEEEEEEEKVLGDDYSEDSGVVKVIKSTKVKGKYKCEACNKLFRSYQALGGHRASHNKIRVNTARKAAAPRAAAAVVEEKIHQCPFCHRVFSSGQALGGHKRSHFASGGAISTNSSTVSPVKKESRIAETLNIDLNLPAPIEEEETSQIAVSAVSDAEFVYPIKQW